MKLILIIPIIFITISLSGQTKRSFSELVSDTSKASLNLPVLPPVDLSEVEVTAYGTPGQLKAAAGSISVISGDRLENSATNIAASLIGVPGVVMQEGSLGTIKLTLRGIGSRYPYGTKKIKLFFGDIPMYSAEGETTFDDINPEYINRIEVLRGPASSIYGSSLGGTVILYPQIAQYNREEIKLISAVGSFGYFKNGITYSKDTEKDNLVLSISGIQTDGYRQNSQYSRFSFYVHQHHIFSENLSSNLILSASQIQSHIPSSVDSATMALNPGKAAFIWLKTKGMENPTRAFAGYNIRYKTVGGWEYSTSLFMNSRITEQNRPFNFLDESGLAYGGRLFSQHSQKTGEATLQFTAGTNFYFENIHSSLSENAGGIGKKGAIVSNGRETLSQIDLFTQLEIHYRRIAITGGVNYNQSGFRFKDLTPTDTLNLSGNYHFAPIVAPRLSLTLNPLNDLYIYTSVNKGFSVPSLSETLSPLGLINRDIKPEKAWCFEMGSRVNLFNHNTFIDLAYYYMRVTDLIVPKRVAEAVYVGMNAGSSLHRGLELTANQWIIGKGDYGYSRHFSLMANINYANNRFNFQNFVSDNIEYSGKKLPGMPDQVFSGSLDLQTPVGFYAKLELNKSGSIPLNDLNNSYSKRWSVINLSGGYIFRLFNHLDIDTRIKVNNLADERYASMIVVNALGTAKTAPRYFYPGLPRWMMCTVIISYRNREENKLQ